MRYLFIILIVFCSCSGNTEEYIKNNGIQAIKSKINDPESFVLVHYLIDTLNYDYYYLKKISNLRTDDFVLAKSLIESYTDNINGLESMKKRNKDDPSKYNSLVSKYQNKIDSLTGKISNELELIKKYQDSSDVREKEFFGYAFICTYREKNIFGGVVKTGAHVFMDKDYNIIDIDLN